MTRLVLRKAMPQGGAHPSHKYLRREGEPGNWHYLYEEDKGQDEQTVPTSNVQSEGGKKISGTGDNGFEGGRSSPGSPRSSGGAGGAAITLNASILRDARPDDLQNPQIVLWTASTEQGVESMRHVGRYIGTHQSGGTLFAANRQAALELAKKGNPVLMAARVDTKALRPVPPAKDIQSSLFPEDGNASQALYPDSVNGNTVVGIIRPGEPLWPQTGDDSEVSRMPQQADQDSE